MYCVFTIPSKSAIITTYSPIPSSQQSPHCCSCPWAVAFIECYGVLGAGDLKAVKHRLALEELTAKWVGEQIEIQTITQYEIYIMVMMTKETYSVLWRSIIKKRVWIVKLGIVPHCLSWHWYFWREWKSGNIWPNDKRAVIWKISKS